MPKLTNGNSVRWVFIGALIVAAGGGVATGTWDYLFGQPAKERAANACAIEKLGTKIDRACMESAAATDALESKHDDDIEKVLASRDAVIRDLITTQKEASQTIHMRLNSIEENQDAKFAKIEDCLRDIYSKMPRVGPGGGQ